jgi:hypothetical protein
MKKNNLKSLIKNIIKEYIKEDATYDIPPYPGAYDIKPNFKNKKRINFFKNKLPPYYKDITNTLDKKVNKGETQFSKEYIKELILDIYTAQGVDTNNPNNVPIINEIIEKTIELLKSDYNITP